ncbi:MAG: hypothetical protein HZB26_18180 [Candidatus Hydrogenedentes bacterium]|nr:hypothetical protein [Candidatus Hydrogenedentota bacterium]
MKNLMGREETVSTCQLDFVVADRFELQYIAKDGSPKTPYIIHRAPLSTHERLISFLIEMYGGAFPTWMAPVQVRIIPVSEHFHTYAREVQALLRDRMLRAEVDEGGETFNKKIRNAVTSKIPNIWIIGEEETSARAVTWRRYCVKDQVKMPMDRAVDAVTAMKRDRLMDNFPDVAIPE